MITQALQVRRKALLLPEPKGDRTGANGSGPTLRLLITGDSSAAGVGAGTQSEALSGQLVQQLSRRCAVTWRLEAATGHTTRDAIARLRSLHGHTFDCAVIALGVNDVTRATSRARFLANQSELWTLLKQQFGVRHILSSGVPPIQHFPLLPQPLAWVLGRHAARLDAGLGELADGHGNVTHIPLTLPQDPALAAPDGFHPNPAAYALWAENLARHIP